MGECWPLTCDHCDSDPGAVFYSGDEQVIVEYEEDYE